MHLHHKKGKVSLFIIHLVLFYLWSVDFIKNTITFSSDRLYPVTNQHLIYAFHTIRWSA